MPEASPIVVSPVLSMLKSVVVAVAVEEPIAKSILPANVSLLLACTERSAHGDVLLIPTLVVVSIYREEVPAAVLAPLK